MITEKEQQRTKHGWSGTGNRRRRIKACKLIPRVSGSKAVNLYGGNKNTK